MVCLLRSVVAGRCCLYRQRRARKCTRQSDCRLLECYAPLADEIDPGEIGNRLMAFWVAIGGHFAGARALSQPASRRASQLADRTSSLAISSRRCVGKLVIRFPAGPSFVAASRQLSSPPGQVGGHAIQRANERASLLKLNDARVACAGCATGASARRLGGEDLAARAHLAPLPASRLRPPVRPAKFNRRKSGRVEWGPRWA